MNNYYVLHHLTKKMNETCTGFSFEFSVSPHKNVWEAYISDAQQTQRIVFSSNSSETALFLDQFRESRNSNITTFFNKLKKRKIINVELLKNDRYISICFSGGYRLLIQAFGNKPNIFLIHENLIYESFKSPDQFTGTEPPEPRKENTSFKKPDISLSPKNQILNIDPKFPRHLISEFIETHALGKSNPEKIKSLVDQAIHDMLNATQFRVLLDGNLCLLPHHMFPAENLEVFDDINAAVRFAYYKTSGQRRFSSKLQSFKPKIETRVQ
jgi:predicted ribosome quality control (RQC) complex YloA/Tae2 family protein